MHPQDQTESQDRSEEQQPKKSPSEAFASFFQSSLYLSLSEGVRRYVTELATLCAEMGVYSSVVGSSSLLMFVRGFAAVLDVGRVRSLLGTEGWEVRNACWREIAERCPGVCVCVCVCVVYVCVCMCVSVCVCCVCV